MRSLSARVKNLEAATGMGDPGGYDTPGSARIIWDYCRSLDGIEADAPWDPSDPPPKPEETWRQMCERYAQAKAARRD